MTKIKYEKKTVFKKGNTFGKNGRRGKDGIDRQTEKELKQFIATQKSDIDKTRISRQWKLQKKIDKWITLPMDQLGELLKKEKTPYEDRRFLKVYLDSSKDLKAFKIINEIIYGAENKVIDLNIQDEVFSGMSAIEKKEFLADPKNIRNLHLVNTEIMRIKSNKNEHL